MKLSKKKTEAPRRYHRRYRDNKNSCKKYYETKKSQHPLGATIQEEGNSLINKIKISSYTGGGNYAYLNDEESNDYNEVNIIYFLLFFLLTFLFFYFII